MKDRKLEEEFNGYFEGMNIPDNLTADAKKYVKKRSSFNAPKFAKIASVAASAVLVAAVSAVLISRADFPAFSNPDNSPSGGNDSENVPVYTASEIVYTKCDPYALSATDPSLKVLKKLAYSQNAQVNGVYTSVFADGEKANVYADFYIVDGSRHETELIIEYASATFEPLKEYRDGKTDKYNGLTYSLTSETDEESGEPVNKLFVSINGVKYYFKITSSDKDSYLKYLKMFY